MNTSASTNQTHHTGTFLRRGMAGGLLAAAGIAAAVGLAATSHADDGAPDPSFANAAHGDVHCQTDRWGTFGSQRRTVCDGPISADGSWSRERTVWVPPHFDMPLCYGSRPSYIIGYGCYGGSYVDQREISSDTYPVRPDTVLPDEPGHLG